MGDQTSTATTKASNRVLQNVRAELIAIKEEVRNDVSGPVIASFGFIIALVWRDAIQAAFGEFLIRAGLTEQAYIFQFISAIIVTIAVIIIMVTLTKITRAKKEEKIEQVVKEEIKQPPKAIGAKTTK